MSYAKSDKFVLAVQPTSRGFGWVLFDGPMSLGNWGISSPKENYASWCMEHFEKLVELYGPDVLILEKRPPDRRSGRVHLLAKNMHGLAANRDIQVHEYTRAEVAEALVSKPDAKRRAVVNAVADHFPILRDRFPDARKPWKEEDHRRCLFDAAALGIAHFRTANPTPGKSRRKPGV